METRFRQKLPVELLMDKLDRDASLNGNHQILF